MKKIRLTRGQFAIVDDQDFEALNKHKWYCSYYGYAVRDEGGRKSKKAIPMHRFLNDTPLGYATDHINRNKLDNRRANLRTVTGSQNGINRGLNKNNTSGCKGVIWRKDTSTWQVRIRKNWKTFYLGCFKRKNDAIHAREQAELIYHHI